MTDALADALARYAQEVMRFNRALNLTGAPDAQTFVARIVRPSLALLPEVPQTGRLLDIGSGNGAPGIPLLLARPQLHGVLIERRKKRAEFLRHLVRLFRLSAEVVAMDARDAPPADADVLVARAVASERELLALGTRHLKAQARAVLIVPRDQKTTELEGWHCIKDWQSEGVRIRCWRRGGST